jgi:hypothetical protein
MKRSVVILLALIIVPCAFAAVGHDAPAIRPGTFATGNYIFPQNISVTGNVGIGTSSPAYKLSLSGLGTSDGILFNGSTKVALTTTTDSGTDSLYYKGLTNGRHTALYIQPYAYSGGRDAALGLYDGDTGGVEGMYIYKKASSYGAIDMSDSQHLILQSSGGNVGIGTTSPNSVLEVRETSIGTKRLAQLGEGIVFTSTNDGQSWMGSNHWGYNGSWSRTAGSTAAIWGTENAGDFAVWTAASGDSQTTAPSDTNKRLVVKNGGNVGIGTTSPGYKLHVSNAGPVEARISDSRATSGDGAKLSIVSGYAWQLIANPTAGTSNNYGLDIYDASNAATRVSISSTGRVGIGMTPVYHLDVNGLIRSSTGFIGPYGSGGAGAGLYTAAGNMILYFDNSGNSHRWDTDAVVKTFVINHPLDSSKYLVHGTLEGPEGAVYYRGTAKLVDGKVEITLPSYFEALTRKEGRTVLLSNVDGFDKLAVKKTAGQQIVDGKFIVYSDNVGSIQEFNWEVKAVRADVAQLVVEPDKKDISVHGDGPYTYAIPNK